MSEEKAKKSYRGRLAPTPSGYLHAGHASTFRIAWERANACTGSLVFRNDDLDPLRCKEEFAQACLDDLKGIGLSWTEGPDCGGSFGPYDQSKRTSLYLSALVKLIELGLAYPCVKSRKEIRDFGLLAKSGEEHLFPEEFRPSDTISVPEVFPGTVNWRFRVKWNKKVSFLDQRMGLREFHTGRDFSDFLVWRKDGVASYELASVVDDHAMGITEIVRGEDLLLSSARQCLLFDAMGWDRPDFYHCKLWLDEKGRKLSKSERNLPRLFSSP
jgi:glutamyl-tRNA synthetase